MPKPFLHQVEALCSMSISVSAESRFYATSKDKTSQPQRSTAPSRYFAQLKGSLPGPLSQNARLIQVPLAFDPKFQRGPLDPYGRPPRLPGQLPALRQPSQDSQRSRSLLANKGSVMPELGAESAATLTMWEAEKRQKQIAHELETSGKYVTADMKEIYSSIPHNLWEIESNKVEQVKGVSLSDETIAAADPNVDMWAFEPSHHRSDEMLEDAQSRSRTISRPHNPPLQRIQGDKVDPLPGGVVESDNDPRDVSTVPSSAQSLQGGLRRSAASRRKHRSRVSSSRRGTSSANSAFDTETMFERPHKCSFEGCNQAFSRVYTLKLHEKSHLMFPEYHKFRHDPLLAFDADADSMMEEARQKLMTRENLPFLRDLELERTLMLSAQGASDGEW